MNKQKFKASAVGIKPTLHIGKCGVEKVAQELKKQLEIKKIVKVKFLKTAFIEENKLKLSKKMEGLTGSELIDVRGNTAVFRRKV